MSKKMVIPPDLDATIKLPADAVLAHLATVRRTVRKIMDERVSDKAQVVSDASCSVGVPTPPPGFMSLRTVAQTVDVPKQRDSLQTSEALVRRFSAAARWETETRSRAALMAEVFEKALDASPKLRTSAQTVSTGIPDTDSGTRAGGPSKRRRVDKSQPSSPIAAIAAAVSLKMPGLKVAAGSPETSMVVVTVPDVMNVTISPRWTDDGHGTAPRWVVERVHAYGLHERPYGPSTERSATFSRVTECAQRAALHFNAQASDTACADFVVWLGSYSDLFRRVCSKCDRILRSEGGELLPPTNRSFGDGSNTSPCAVHTTCLFKP